MAGASGETFHVFLFPPPHFITPEIPPSEMNEIRKNAEIMDDIRSIYDRYGGEARILLSIVDGDETVFNALITVSEDILVRIEPMESYEGEYDSRFTIEFDFLYDIILTSERDMRGGHVEYPPWESRPVINDMFSGMLNGMSMWLKMTAGVSSGQVRAEPAGSLNDGLSIMQFVFESGGEGEPDE